jgi:hypothetical protein
MQKQQLHIWQTKTPVVLKPWVFRPVYLSNLDGDGPLETQDGFDRVRWGAEVDDFA